MPLHLPARLAPLQTGYLLHIHCMIYCMIPSECAGFDVIHAVLSRYKVLKRIKPA